MGGSICKTKRKNSNSYWPEGYWDDIWNKYGITKDDYMRMFREQDGRCAICRVEQHRVDRRFAVDHNHITDKVRGLLCPNCNAAIGMLKDNIENMKRAIAYIEHYTS